MWRRGVPHVNARGLLVALCDLLSVVARLPGVRDHGCVLDFVDGLVSLPCPVLPPGGPAPSREVAA